MGFTDNLYRRLGVTLALAFAVAMLVLVYQPGLGGSFLLDDRHNIELNEDIQISDLSFASLSSAWEGGKTGGLGRPVSYLSFALTQFFMDGSAYSFKLTNVVLHVLNMVLVMGFATSLLRFWGESQQLAITRRQILLLGWVIGFLWALHPLQVSTVLYAVQRMTILSTMFTVAALWLYIVWRTQLHKEGVFRWVAPLLMLVLVSLGVLSKENAILFFGFIGALELFSYRQLRMDGVGRLYSNIFWLAALIAVVFAIGYLHFFQNWYAGSYQARNFDLTDRLMTQSRMMFIYLQWILFPSIDQYGLFHDDIAISRGLLSPATTLWSMLGLFSLVGAALAFRRTLPWLGYGICFYLIGHSLEGSFIPLELVFEHRNYLPSLGVIIVVVIVLFNLSRLLNTRARVYSVIAIVAIVFLASMTYLRSMEWSSYFGQISAATERQPLSPRANWAMGIWYLQTHSQELAMGINDPGLYQRGKEYALKAANADDEYVSSLLGLILFHFQHGREYPQEWLYDAGGRLENSPYRVGTDDYFRQMIKCTQSDECYAVRSDVDYLFQKVLENKTLTNGARSNLLSGYSAFKYHFDEYEMSVSLLEESMAITPTYIGYRNLTVLALEMRDKRKAEEFFKLLKALSGIDDSDEVLRLEKYVDGCCDSLPPKYREN